MSADLSYHGALVSLQNELGRFVIQEHAAQRESIHARWGRPVSERVEEGYCISELRVTDQPKPGVWVLECAYNDSRFREGDFVRLSQGDPQSPFMEGVVRTIGDTTVQIMQIGKSGEQRCSVGQIGICLDESFIDLEARYSAAIDDLGKTAVGRDLILPLLRGDLRPKVDAADASEAYEGALNDGMNDRQSEAVSNAIGSDVCWLIHGPPGTGKTRVLAWIVTDLLAKGQRVLVTSFTHRAINNLIAAVAGRIPDSRRLAKVAAFDDPMLPQSIEQRGYFRELSFAKDAGGYVIAATPFALRSARLAGKDFDTVIIDEASQVTVPLAVMAMLSARKFILAGDHQQLPPVTASLTPAESVKMSIFGRLVGRGFDTLLNTTHRLNDELCQWPSDTFYQSDLRAHPRAAGRRLLLSSCPEEWTDVLAPDRSVVWMALPHRGSRTDALEEVTLVSDIIRALHEAGLRWEEIGVVVPFRRQARLIRQRIGRRLPDRLAPAALTIDTVERMQGQEREVIVVSFTTSDEAFAHRLQDFLFQPQRLNVAATRPRSKLILVASPVLLKFAEGRAEEHAGAACFVTLLQSAHRIDVPLPGIEE
jgi:DNA replication ATP-dependent helicase Dna2